MRVARIVFLSFLALALLIGYQWGYGEVAYANFICTPGPSCFDCCLDFLEGCIALGIPPLSCLADYHLCRDCC